jgi:hypothetical protein
MAMNVCRECGDEFNPDSPQKRKVGGLRIHCVDCSDESTIRYAGVQGADGKQASVSILRFNSQADRENYLVYWQNNSGLHKGKSCQIGRGVMSKPNISFSTVAVFEGNTNHKGKG